MSHKKKSGKKKRLILIGAVLICIFLGVWTIWGNKAVIMSEFSVSSPRLPSSFSGYCIAQVSDLHNTEFGEGNTTLLQMLSECQPDIIVITGDLIDAQHTNIEVALDFSKGATQIAPTYYVTGNHEASSTDYAILKDGLEVAGVVILEDEAIYLERNGETITLLGLADPDFTIKGGLFGEVPAMVSTKLKNMLEQDTVYSVLLSHRPELFETYVACGVDLILSGHAHGGQIRLPIVGGIIAPDQGLFPKYDAGLFTDGNTNMIVSRGLGNSIIPIRFNNRPEVILVEFNAE